MTKILIIEDDKDIAELLKLQLQLKNYTPIVAHNFAGASAYIKQDIDLFLIDRMLPDSSGLEICKLIRKQSEHESTPIIMITAMAEPVNIIEGLDAGADDYITKPFDINILHARLRAHLRRTKDEIKKNEINIGPLHLNIEKCEVKIDNEAINLTNTEFQILVYMALEPGIVHSREKLIREILGDEVHVTNRTIDTHIAGLRKKLGIGSNIVETIRGVGYRLKENV